MAYIPTTLSELEELPGEILTCQQISKILCADANTLHTQAVMRPELLGFPVIVAGSRVKIPKQAFIKFMRGELSGQDIRHRTADR